MSRSWITSGPHRVDETAARIVDVEADDGHRWQLQARLPPAPRARLLWLPALGVPARHYLPLADALAARGVAVFVHEWRGLGSSNLRASRECDWAYRELLTVDLPASERAARRECEADNALLGGHSLGGQLASCFLGLSPTRAQGLWLVGSGSPYSPAFPAPLRFALPMAYRFLPWLAQRVGHLPGPRVGFGGREARGVIRDWSRSAMTGRYQMQDTDLEAPLSSVAARIRAVVLANDWMAPRSSLDYLLSKMPHARADVRTLGDAELGVRSDHFAWMKQPAEVAASLAAD